MTRRIPTPSQTVGPFFGVLVQERGTLSLASPDTPGPRLRVDGTLRDGAGQGVADALVECWQADAGGRHRHPDDPRAAGATPSFRGFGRSHTEPDGTFVIDTVRPGPVSDTRGALQAPHLLLGIYARGLLRRLVTRIYLADEPANETDPVLSLVPPERRSTLLATPLADGHYRIDLHLQGPRETVFLDV